MVNVEFRISAKGRPSEQGLLGVFELEPLEDATTNNTENRTKRSLRAPIGQQGGAERVQIQPGKYIVRLRLPSGVKIIEHLEVRAEPTIQNVILGEKKPKRSTSDNVALENKNYTTMRINAKRAVARAESLAPNHLKNSKDEIAWQTTVDFKLVEGYLRPAKQYGMVRSQVMVSPTSVLIPKQFIQFAQFRPIPLYEYLKNKENDTDNIKDITFDKAEFEIIPCHGHESDTILQTSAQHCTFGWNPSHFLSNLEIDLYDLPLREVRKTQSYSRIFVDLTTSNHSSPNYLVLHPTANSIFQRNSIPRDLTHRIKLIRLPGRWLESETGNLKEIFLDIKRKSVSQFPSINVTVSDPKIQSILDFSQLKDLDGALSITEQCVETLMAKVENPYAAAAAGYILLMAPKERTPPYWHNWIGNLGAWFADLPDGKIQHATLLLQGQAEDNTNIDVLDEKYFPRGEVERSRLAATLLIDALHIGLPLYRAGFNHLASNLGILCEDLDLPIEFRASVQEAKRFVNTCRMRLDTTQPFTTIDITDLV